MIKLNKKSESFISDETLIEQYNSGDIDSFHVLYQRFATDMYTYALRHRLDAAVANDILQIVWEKIILKQDDFVLKIKRSHPPFVFKFYLYKMVKNAILDHFRHHSKEITMEDNEDSYHAVIEAELTTLDEDMIAEEKYKKLIGAIEALPYTQRETFLLIKEAGLSLKEVADIQEISIETAKTRRRYAYDKLKPYLEAMQ